MCEHNYVLTPGTCTYHQSLTILSASRGIILNISFTSLFPFYIQWKKISKNKFIYYRSKVGSIRHFKSVNSYKRMHRTLEQICSKWFNPSSLACVAYIIMLIRSVWLRNRISLSITPTLRLYCVCTLNPILSPIWMTCDYVLGKGGF